MERKIFESFVGKQVEVFLVPDTPQTSGVVLSCEDDYLVIGEELWAYPAVLGIRPLKKSNRNSYINPPAVQRAETVTYSEEINSEAEKKAVLPRREKPAEQYKHEKQEEIKEEKVLEEPKKLPLCQICLPAKPLRQGADERVKRDHDQQHQDHSQAASYSVVFHIKIYMMLRSFIYFLLLPAKIQVRNRNTAVTEIMVTMLAGLRTPMTSS